MKKTRKKISRYLLKKRLARDNFFGLTLTILVVILIYIFVLFGAVIGNYLPLESLMIFDQKVNNFILASRVPSLVNLFFLITAFALPQFAIGMSIAFTAFLSLKKKRVYLMPFLVSFLGGVLTNFLSKISLQRGRPINAIYTESTYSFPSGHSTLAVVLYGFVIYYFWKRTKSRAMKSVILAIGILFILAIGFSRIYLGVHFFSDILGGYLLGLIWLCTGIGLAEWRLEKRSIKLIVG
ncbi:MAG: phosphatase PAP2 family protein [Patescibacteria group bacterium]